MTRPLLLTAFLCSCATAASPEPAQPNSAEPATAESVSAQLPDDPVEAVRVMRQTAASDPTRLAVFVDEAFVERMPSSGELATTLGPAPEGCELQLSLEEGYGAIAIPPPMVDDSDEKAAEVQAVIDALSAGVEVHGTCSMEFTELDEGDDGEPVESTYQRDVAVFGVALSRDESGWRILGWRHFYAETGQNH